MTTTGMAKPHQLRDAYRRINDRIARAAERSGRPPRDVLLVAVTKYASPDQIRSLVEMGQIDLGENHAQPLAQRARMLTEFLSRKRFLSGAKQKTTQQIADAVPSVRWHMLGHLQRNKIKQVVPLVRLVHSVDNLRLAEEVHNFAVRTERVIDILIQVNTSGEATKFGVAAPAAIHLAEQIDTMVNLRPRGLMTIAPMCDDPEQVRSVFARTHEIFQEVHAAKIGGPDWNILSMGMTNDFEVAIEEGANVVRIGRGLFGDEPS